MAGEEGSAIDEGENDNSTDYESDLDEVKLSLKMRRRVASDDEHETEDRGSVLKSGDVDSGVDSDDQGGVDDYDEEIDVEEEEEYYDDGYEDEVEEVGGEVEESEIEGRKAVEKAEIGSEVKGEGEGEGEEEEEEEKKEVEPFAVPTSGAFYMHDDRFRGNAAGGRHRRTFDGRKLWESKDERKWGHDKFEELNLQDRHYDEGKRSSKGSFRGRGRGRGSSRGANIGYSRGGRVRENSGNRNQNAAPKDVRGRGPRRYQPLTKNKGETHSPQYKQSARSFDKNSQTDSVRSFDNNSQTGSARSFDKNSHTGSGRMTGRSFDKMPDTDSGRMAAATGNSNVEYETASAKIVGSNLSSASPPFYPSGASTKDIVSAQKREMHTGNHTKNMQPSVDPNFMIPISDPMLKGKIATDSTGTDKFQIDYDVTTASAKTITNLHLQSPASSSLRPNQFAHPRGPGDVVASSRPAVFHQSQTNNQVNKVSPLANQRSPALPQDQSPVQTPGQQLAQRPLVASQSLSPPTAGKGAIQGTRRGALAYSGNGGDGHGNPNIPAFFPVMQFGDQHPGGMGVPAVGMAFPGYVAQPNGLGNSEMKWLPMLASAAGALGATYCPPYLPVDGTCSSRPSGQTSALPAPSIDNNLSKPSNQVKPQQRSDVANDEFSQRQNKPRRYSEMSFSQ